MGCSVTSPGMLPGTARLPNSVPIAGSRVIRADIHRWIYTDRITEPYNYIEESTGSVEGSGLLSIRVLTRHLVRFDFSTSLGRCVNSELGWLASLRVRSTDRTLFHRVWLKVMCVAQSESDLFGVRSPFYTPSTRQAGESSSNRRYQVRGWPIWFG